MGPQTCWNTGNEIADGPVTGGTAEIFRTRAGPGVSKGDLQEARKLAGCLARGPMTILVIPKFASLSWELVRITEQNLTFNRIQSRVVTRLLTSHNTPTHFYLLGLLDTVCRK